MSAKRVLLSGAYGAGNVGDEAILYGLVALLEKSGIESTSITALSHAPQETTKMQGVHSVKRLYFPEDLIHLSSILSALRNGSSVRALTDIDLAIIGGGGLFYDYPIYGAPTWRSPIAYRALEALLLKHLCGSLLLYGVGVGPVRTSIGRLMMQFICSRADCVSVRDAESRKILNALGIKSRVKVVPDPAAMIEPDFSTRVCSLSRNFEMEDVRVAVSLRPWSISQGDTVFVRSMGEVCNKLISGYGAYVMLMPMHYRDVEILTRVQGYVSKQDKTLMLKQVLTAPEMSALISKMTMVVGMRLHSLILSAAQSVPSVGLAYAPKIKAFMGQIGQEGSCLTVHSLTADSVLTTFESTLSSAPHIKRSLNAWKEWAIRESVNAVQEIVGNCSACHSSGSRSTV